MITDVESEIEMVKFDDGLIITNYHPVLIENQWKFPIDLKPAEKIYVSKYYNFVLEEGHSLLVNGVHCISLGHGIKEDVAEHEYLGTEKVINDLERLDGWDEGEVNVNLNMVVRDPRTNLIVGFKI